MQLHSAALKFPLPEKSLQGGKVQLNPVYKFVEPHLEILVTVFLIGLPRIATRDFDSTDRYEASRAQAASPLFLSLLCRRIYYYGRRKDGCGPFFRKLLNAQTFLVSSLSWAGVGEGWRMEDGEGGEGRERGRGCGVQFPLNWSSLCRQRQKQVTAPSLPPCSLPHASVYRPIYLSGSFLPFFPLFLTENRFCDHLETDLSL